MSELGSQSNTQSLIYADHCTARRRIKLEYRCISSNPTSNYLLFNPACIPRSDMEIGKRNTDEIFSYFLFSPLSIAYLMSVQNL